jgi:hypothetical protein
MFTRQWFIESVGGLAANMPDLTPTAMMSGVTVTANGGVKIKA